MVNSYYVKLIYLNFQPPEVVSRYRDPQPQVVENYSYLFILRQSLNIHFIPNNSAVTGQKRLLS